MKGPSLRCADYFALPHLTCGLVAGHDGPHAGAGYLAERRRVFRWVFGRNGGRTFTKGAPS